MAKKIDLKKEYKTYYKAKDSPEIVEFKEINYLIVQGKGKPGGEEFTIKVEALYSLAYGIKNICKGQGNDFVVPKLEGLWWVNSEKLFIETPREEWRWKLLIRMPNFVFEEIIKKAKQEVILKKEIELVNEIEFGVLCEGKCVQILHIGSYSTEQESIEKIRDYINNHDYVENGIHHEIYLSDPRRVNPEKMKTILRQPVRKGKK